MNCSTMTITKTRHLIPALGLVLVLSGVGLSAEKSVIIGFKHAGKAGNPVATLRALSANCRVGRCFKLIPAVAARIPEEEIEKLRRDPAIAYVEESALYTTATLSGSQTEVNDSWQVTRIFADAAHASGNLGTGVKVAVLDTGIDYTHEDLDANYRGGYDFVFDDNDPLDDSYRGHGTHVAGIIAAERNGIGVVGVAPEAELYAVKVLDGGGFGLEEWIIAGIEWAVENGVDIINMSLTGPDRDGLREACERARDAGVLLVAAGGNSSNGGGPVKYPAAYSSVIAVTGTDLLDLPGYFAPVGDTLELAAPGVDVYSTAANGEYRMLSGTSQASACVAGAAALYIRSLDIDLNADQLVDNEDVRLMLRLTATDLGQPGVDDTYGFGLVNALVTSFEPSSRFTLARNSLLFEDNVGVAEVADAVHCITIANNRLRFIMMDVFEGVTRRDDLSRLILLGRNSQRNSLFWLDATGTNYTLHFTPFGVIGSSASIDIKRASQ